MYPDATSSTSPTTDPPVPPPPLTTAEARKIRWRARGGFAEAWAWRCEGFTGYRPFLHALACALVLGFAGCVVETAHAQEHSHRFSKSSEDSEECCARWDKEKGTNSSGGEIEIKKCGQWGVKVTVNYTCDCGATKSTPMPCRGV